MGDEFLEVFEARDVSIGGVGVMVPHRFAGYDLHAEVELVVTLPGMAPFTAKGVIRHNTDRVAERPVFGIEFTRIATEDVARLQRYVDRRIAEGGGT